ncbi:MAG: VOC family protein [Candidatus Baltobacteraceae bacterium]|jgi:predicted enzyme related to lactoylglutathione lyase
MVSDRAFKITGIDLSGYMVKDAPRAIAFYRDVLGLEPTSEYPGGMGAEYEFPDGSTFGLWHGGDDMPWQRGNGLLFAVDDLGAAVAAVKAAGCKIEMEYESPICFMAMTEDSEGNQLILHKRKPAQA